MKLKTDIAIFRPSTGQWIINGGSGPITFRTSSDIPVPGDYLGQHLSRLKATLA